MSKTPSKSLRLLHWLGPILLVLLIFKAGPRNLLEHLRHANPWWLLLAWALNLPQLGLKAYRWYRTVRWQGIRLGYGRALLAYFSSLLVGFLTPGRVGEMAKVFTLKYECGVPIARGLSSVIFDRVFDLYLLLVLGSFGLIRYSLVGTVFSWPVLAAIVLLFALPLPLLNERVVRWLGERLGRMPFLGRRAEKIKEKADQFADGLATMTPGRLAICVLLTLASYTFFFLQCTLCAWALGFTAPFLDLVFLMAATNLMSFIPISISGLGTREACLIYFLARIQPPQPASVAVTYGLMLFLVLFIGGGLIGYVCWQWAPIGLRQAVQDVRLARRKADVIECDESMKPVPGAHE